MLRIAATAIVIKRSEKTIRYFMKTNAELLFNRSVWTNSVNTLIFVSGFLGKKTGHKKSVLII